MNINVCDIVLHGHCDCWPPGGYYSQCSMRALKTCPDEDGHWHAPMGVPKTWPDEDAHVTS